MTPDERNPIDPADSGLLDSPQAVPTVAGSSEPHPRLAQYTVDEVERATDVFRLLIKVRDRCRAQGLIDW